MGSATRHALATATAAIETAGAAADLTAAEELFSVSTVLDENQQVRAALGDPAADGEAKATLIRALFGSRLGDGAGAVLGTAVAQRWSHPGDIVSGVEELGIRVAAHAAADPERVQRELFAFGGAVASDAELELALGSRLGLEDAKRALVTRLLSEKAAPATTAIVLQVVLHPRGRSVRAAVARAADVVADQSGRTIARVTVAAPVASAQLDALAGKLSAQYGTTVSINQIVDPAVVGGMRVRIGDEVIDGTIATRLAEVRRRLAG